MKKLFLLMICGLLFLAGCGREQKSVKAPELEAEEQVEQEQTDEEQALDGEETKTFVPRDLSNAELQEFTMWISQGSNYGNYGFLMSEYTKPQDVDLSQVFYAGAGLETEPLTKEEEQAYLEITEQEEIYTDCTRLTTDQINEFLEAKLNLSLDDMENELEWVYLPDSDAWVWQHGDTNYINYTCVSGRQIAADTFELNCVPGDENFAPYALPSCRLTLQKYGDDYRFLSNIYVAGLEYSKDIWKVEDQTFDVNLEGWGDVTFTSYEGFKSTYGNMDFTFSLVQEGEEVYQFPSVVEENYRQRELPEQILAVGFKDYNQDDDTDVIILVEYKPYITTGEPETETFVEVRLYRNEPDSKKFILDIDKMDYLNINGLNHSIQEAMEHIEESPLQ
ncbi:MAG: hypothetical protein HFJ10_06600 [Lachnospiraceae bacterium]|jgi:hypothetical protein|nr:hypothetical protein [Lachnospiraceae bacterium]